jgi:hypothetical protein
MGSQLALFPGIVPLEAPAVAEPCPPLDIEWAPALALPGQVGLFDEHVQRFRTAREALALGDLPRAVSLLEKLAPEFDPAFPVMLRRARELRGEIQRLRRLPLSARTAANVEIGRRLAPEGEPWSSLGRVLLSRAAAELVPADGLVAGRLFLEAHDLERARHALLTIHVPPNAATLFALGDVESALGDRSAARRCYCDALLLDPFNAALDGAADEDVRGLPYVAEFEAEVDGDPRAWCAPVGIVAGVLPRPPDRAVDLPMPADVPADRSVLLARSRVFVDALVRAGSPDVQKNRDALLETRRCMKRASAPLFAWYMARQVGAS